eukprot:187699-Rhodomonas_salina.1
MLVSAWWLRRLWIFVSFVMANNMHALLHTLVPAVTRTPSLEHAGWAGFRRLRGGTDKNDTLGLDAARADSQQHRSILSLLGEDVINSTAAKHPLSFGGGEAWELALVLIRRKLLRRFKARDPEGL